MHIQFNEFETTTLENTSPFQRTDYAIDDKDFVLCVVGNRLDIEITDEFLDMIEMVIERNPAIKVIVIGKYTKEIRPELKDSIINLGPTEYLESALRLSNLYINPKRGGGGTSAKISIKNGIPVLTLPYGDIANIVGKEFICSDYNEMADYILEHSTNSTFHNKKCTLAKNIYSTNYDIDMFSQIKSVVNEAQTIARMSE